MKARFFYAPASYQTWPKLFVLTPDGILYCKYLDKMRPTSISKLVDYSTFKPEDYKFGGYQHIEEISYEEASKMVLTKQTNWIDVYLKKKIGSMVDDEKLREELLDDCIASFFPVASDNHIEDYNTTSIHSAFSKDSKEYFSNGHYKINGKDFMSVWTFKKVFGVYPNNTNTNGAEGKNLIAQGIKFFASIPDFGGFNTIYIYPVCELIRYYRRIS